MATSKFNKVVQKNNITYTNLNMRNATNGFKTRKHVYRYAKKSLVGGSAGSAWRAEVYKSFIDNVAQLIPDTKAQTKVSSDEFNKPITINNTQFPNNIILYAFIILYCLKVHNFKINTTEDGTKNKLLLTGLVDILIRVLKNMLYTKAAAALIELINSNDKDFYVKDSEELFKILDIILREGNTTTTKALDAVKVENYFTINEQKSRFVQLFRKSKISSITINVVPVTKHPIATNETYLITNTQKALHSTTPVLTNSQATPLVGANDVECSSIKNIIEQHLHAYYTMAYNTINNVKYIFQCFTNKEQLQEYDMHQFYEMIVRIVYMLISKHIDKINKHSYITPVYEYFSSDANVDTNFIAIKQAGNNACTNIDAITNVNTICNLIMKYYTKFIRYNTIFNNLIPHSIARCTNIMEKQQTNNNTINSKKIIASLCICVYKYLTNIMLLCVILYAIEKYETLRGRNNTNKSDLSALHTQNPNVKESIV